MRFLVHLHDSSKLYPEHRETLRIVETTSGEASIERVIVDYCGRPAEDLKFSHMAGVTYTSYYDIDLSSRPLSKIAILK